MEYLIQQLQEARIDIVGGTVSGLIITAVSVLVKVLWVDVGTRRLTLIFVGTITAVIGLYFLGISVRNSLILVGGVIGACGCLYYLMIRDEPKVHYRRHYRSKRRGPYKFQSWRLLAKSGAVAFLVLALTAGLAHQMEQSNLRKKLLILVADFDGPKPDEFKVTEIILANLNLELQRYRYLRVEALGQAITQAEGSGRARMEGARNQASMVIWGWYGSSEESVPVSVNFELPVLFPGLCPAAKGAIRTQPLAELNSFSLQTNLAEEINQLTHFAIGMIHFSTGHYERAIVHFTEATDLAASGGVAQFRSPEKGSYVVLMDPNYAYFFRGMAYTILGKSDLAIADFDEIVGRNSQLDQDIAFSTNLDRVYINRATILLDRNDVPGAISDLDKALILNDESALAYFYRGLAHQQEENYEAAIQDLTRAIELNEDNECAYIQRGNVFDDMGDNDAAIADYSKAIGADPNSALGYVNIGLIHRKEKNFEDARAQFEKAIQVDPESTFGHYYLGLDSEKNNDLESAIAHYSKVIEVDPEFSGIYYQRADLYEKQNEPEKAIEDYIQSLLYTSSGDYTATKITQLCHDYDLCTVAREAIDNEIKDDSIGNGWLYYARAKIYIEDQNYPSAIDDLTAAINIDPTKVSWLEARADVYRDMDEKELALSDYVRLVSLEGSYSHHRSDLARFCEKAEICRETAIEITKLMIEQPESVRLILARAKVYQTYDMDKALNDYIKAETLDPDDPEIYKSRAQTLETTDNREKALSDYLRVIAIDSDDLNTAYQISRICEKLENCSEIVGTLSTAIYQEGETNSLLFTRGRVYETLEQNEQALDDYTRLTKMIDSSGLFNIYSRRAKVYEKLGRLDEAIEDYTTLIQNHNSSDALYQRGLIYHLRGEMELARADLEAYLEKHPSTYRKEEIEEILRNIE